MKPDIWVVRHGQTAWSASGRHTSHTDVPLTAHGRAAAVALAPRLAEPDFALVLVSPAARALETARLAGFADADVDGDLRERDYGQLEGATTAEIRARGPGWRDWSVWTGPVPDGETLADVATRARRVVARCDTAGGAALLFGHGHQLRILAAVAVDLDPAAGARLVLDPATVSIIGHEHELRAVRVWNHT
ncbi:MAG TPA: histidine phosphatase family protein [Acidimicrobiia bacterium]|nr:histidine phosphatase family protein [Acidimicrobiia bacterium]